MIRNAIGKFLLLAHGLLFLTAAARADMITLDFTVSYGETPADGGAPWVTATIANGIDSTVVLGTGEVLLTITASSELNEADITQLYFNFAPGDPENLTFVVDQDGDVGSYTILHAAADAYKAGGDGFFDILIDLPSENTDSERLNAGESISFIVSYSGGDLTPENFYALSFDDGGEESPGPFLAAAHIQSTGFDELGSDWVAAVPIPATIWLLTSSLGMLCVAARRRRRLLAAA